MKKCVWYIMFVVLSVNVQASVPDLQVYRRMMEESLNDKVSAQAFYDHTRKIGNEQHPTLLGYKAMSEFMMCNHVSGPFNKLAYFNRGKKILETAILRDNDNVELRFMRFCTQATIPAILNYNSELDGDKDFLIQYLKTGTSKDRVLRELIREYLLDHKLCSSSEKETIKNL